METDCKIASEIYLERCDQRGHTELKPPSEMYRFRLDKRTLDIILATCDKRQRRKLKREFHALMDH